MTLVCLAKDLLVSGWSVQAARSELRGTVLSCGDFPTCSAVEEAIGEAQNERQNAESL